MDVNTLEYLEKDFSHKRTLVRNAAIDIIKDCVDRTSNNEIFLGEYYDEDGDLIEGWGVWCIYLGGNHPEYRTSQDYLSSVRAITESNGKKYYYGEFNTYGELQELDEFVTEDLISLAYSCDHMLKYQDRMERNGFCSEE